MAFADMQPSTMRKTFVPLIFVPVTWK